MISQSYCQLILTAHGLLVLFTQECQASAFTLTSMRAPYVAQQTTGPLGKNTTT